MDISELSMVMSQSSAQQSSGIVAMKMALNTRINYLAIQVKALDGERRRREEDKILE